ncbi:MAG: DnaJ family domain-containing protein [Anaerolineales bacterium]|nr:DnaJ family domain-containing protein [Anaerolineales bacterium]
MKWDKEIEKKIQEALESGAFDNLPGAGEPLSLADNPHEDPTWSLAFHLLKSNEFSLPWVEKRKEIDRETESARASLRRAWTARQGAGRQVSRSDDLWQNAVAAFETRVEEINRLIRSYNLEVPLDRLQMFPLDARHEIEAIKKSG